MIHDLDKHFFEIGLRDFHFEHTHPRRAQRSKHAFDAVVTVQRKPAILTITLRQQRFQFGRQARWRELEFDLTARKTIEQILRGATISPRFNMAMRPHNASASSR